MGRWVLRKRGEIERTNKEVVVCEISGEGLGGDRLEGVVLGLGRRRQECGKD
jgi:hypothetical protein